MEISTGRKTRQLEVVWHEVAGDNSHPTADQIYQRVRRHIPSISLGTVYRNLQKLVAEGKLQVLPSTPRVAVTFYSCVRSLRGLLLGLHSVAGFPLGMNNAD